MGFSAGASLTGLYLLQKQQRGENAPFECAVFLSVGSIVPALEALGIRELSNKIQIPSVHVWGSRDEVAPTGGIDLYSICEPSRRLSVVHDGGHEVPRKTYVTECVHTIRRIVALALAD
jgi:pimeloyl-ACP methyl ester carboxylesterase